MSEAWGTTGRVTLQESLQEPDDRYVRVDGEFFGHAVQVWYPERGWCGFDATLAAQSPTFPSRDAAVMWVLRRTAPDVWRAERPVVYQVVRGPDVFPMGRWHLHYADADDRSWNPNCVPEHVDSDPTWESAFPYAVRRASAEYAARAAR